MDRSKERAELEACYKWTRPDPMDTSRFVKMGARKLRRARARSLKTPFRPVCGHAIPAPDHKSYIRALTTMDRRRASYRYKKV